MMDWNTMPVMTTTTQPICLQITTKTTQTTTSPDRHHPQPTDEQHGPQAGNQLPAPDDNQEEDLATTASGNAG